jgi:hypothetical protein
MAIAERAIAEWAIADLAPAYWLMNSVISGCFTAC